METVRLTDIFLFAVVKGEPYKNVIDWACIKYHQYSGKNCVNPTPIQRVELFKAVLRGEEGGRRGGNTFISYMYMILGATSQLITLGHVFP